MRGKNERQATMLSGAGPDRTAGRRSKPISNATK